MLPSTAPSRRRFLLKAPLRPSLFLSDHRAEPKNNTHQCQAAARRHRQPKSSCSRHWRTTRSTRRRRSAGRSSCPFCASANQTRQHFSTTCSRWRRSLAAAAAAVHSCCQPKPPKKNHTTHRTWRSNWELTNWVRRVPHLNVLSATSLRSLGPCPSFAPILASRHRAKLPVQQMHQPTALSNHGRANDALATPTKQPTLPRLARPTEQAKQTPPPKKLRRTTAVRMSHCEATRLARSSWCTCPTLSA